MKQLVIMPGGFHPFHAGHAALYQSAVDAFPGADVYVAATNDTSTRPFPFKVKEKLAQLAGVTPNRFVQVKSPFRAEEIVHKFDPNNTQLIFVRSEKDAGSQPRPGGTKKDGTPSYLQPYDDASDQPLSQRAYMAYLPTVEFGPGMTSATEIRGAWPQLNEKRKTALVMSLYPKTQTNPKLAATVVKLLDTAMGTVDESALDNLPRPNKRNQFKSLHKQRKQRGLDEQGMAEGDVVPFARPGQTLTWQQVPKDVLLLANDWFWASEDNSGLDAVIDPKGFGNGTANDVKYLTAKLQQKGWTIDYNDENDGIDEYNLVLTNRRGNSVLLSINDAQSFTGWADGTNNLNETIGPHQNELLLMLRTDKPAAIIDRDEIYKWREYIQENGWTMLSFGRPPIYSGERVWQSYIISKDPATAMQIRDLMDGAFSGKIKFNSAYHAKLGKLLGYSAWDIAHFILKGAVTGTGRLLFDFFKQLFSKDAKQSAGKEASKPLGIKENTAPNPRVDLTPNYPNYATLVGEFIGVKKNRVLFRIVSAELKPGQGETEKIFRAMSTNTPIGIDIGRVKNRAVLEALKPDAFAALQQAKQRIEQNRQQEVDQWAQDFRANSAKLAGQQLKQRFAEPPPEPPTMPVVQPGESPDALKDRLAQLNIAKQKFEEINALIRAIKKKYQHSAIEAEITAIERRLETGLLPDVRAGVADNYKSLLAKLDNLKTSLTTRFIVKEAPDYIEEGRKI
jgi:hypothetical protein